MDIKRLKISIHLPGFGKTAIAEGTSDNNKVGKATPNPKNINTSIDINGGCTKPHPIAAPIYGPVHGVATITVNNPNRTELV